MTPMLFSRSTSRRIPMTLKRFETRLAIPDPALVDAHVGEPRERGLVGYGPCHCLAEAVDLVRLAPSNSRRAARPRATSRRRAPLPRA